MRLCVLTLFLCLRSARADRISIHFERPGKSLDITGENMADVLLLVDALSSPPARERERDLRPYEEDRWVPKEDDPYENEFPDESWWRGDDVATIPPESDEIVASRSAAEANKIFHILHTLRGTLRAEEQPEESSAWKSLFHFLY